MRAENAPRLVAIAAPGPGHGKSTLAKALRGHGRYQIRPFARPMKAMAEALLREMGWSWEQIDLFLTDPEHKEECIPELGVSMRTFLQRLGTEFGREQIGEQLWINVWRKGALKAMDDGMPVVVDDCRFENEFEMLKGLGALMVYVERVDLEGGPGWKHASEGSLKPHHFDVQLIGQGLDELKGWGRRIALGQVEAEGVLVG
jgi:hypothetical protein